MSDQLSAQDLAEIHQVLARFAHAFDNADAEGLASVFSEDAVVETTRSPGSIRQGLKAFHDFSLAIGPDRPDHHTLDSVVFVGDDGVVRARSRYIAVLVDTSVHNGEFLDVLVQTPDGWRISRRISVPRFPRAELVPLPQETLDAWRLPGRN